MQLPSEDPNYPSMLSRFGAGLGRTILGVGSLGLSEIAYANQAKQQEELKALGEIINADAGQAEKVAALSRLGTPQAIKYAMQLTNPENVPADVRSFREFQKLTPEQQAEYQRFTNPVEQITPYQQAQLEIDRQNLDLDRQKLQNSDDYVINNARSQASELSQRANALQAAGRTQEAAAVRQQAQAAASEVDRLAPRKLSATEQKEFYEAQDKVNAADTVISSLTDALNLNDKTFTGVTASARAAANNIPLIRNFIPDEAAKSTVEFENIIGQQALDNLKASFGGAPTEGERKFLLDLQANVNSDPKTRQRILERGIKLAQQRKERELAKMQGISKGTIYGNGTQSQKAPSIGEGTIIENDAGQRMIRKGGQWQNL